jgi:SAM-dependent methyltransferase
MTVDPVWERIHSTREWGKYPPEALIRFMATRFRDRPERKDVKILDLCCGLGSAAWLFAREGFQTSAIDAAPSAIRRLSDRLAAEGLHADLHVGDVVTSLPDIFQPRTFDVVVEVRSLCALPRAEAQKVSADVASLLKPGGCFFSMTFDVTCWGHGLGTQVEPHGFTDIPEGPFKGMGFARFEPRERLPALYEPLKIVSLESSGYTLGGGEHAIKEWVVQCEHRHR